MTIENESSMSIIRAIEDCGRTEFVVRYCDYNTVTFLTPNNEQTLRLAIQATPGASMTDPIQVGHSSTTGLYEDLVLEFECKLDVSLPNVTALKATDFSWDNDATRLAMNFDIAAELVNRIRADMAHIYQTQLATMRKRFMPDGSQ